MMVALSLKDGILPRCAVAAVRQVQDCSAPCCFCLVVVTLVQKFRVFLTDNPMGRVCARMKPPFEGTGEGLERDARFMPAALL